MKGITDYELIQENDNIMACISGGKDSFLMAKCLQELQAHGNVKFNLHFVTMNPGYNDENLKLIQENAKMMNIQLEVFNTDIFDITATVAGNPCYLCARMRRGYLYNKAEELGCNKIALGHHFDDVIETTLLSMFYGAEIKTMMPKLYSDNYQGLELIRPMYLVKENAIIAWRNYNELKFLNCACRFTENCSLDSAGDGKRSEMKKLIKNLRQDKRNIDNNIFTSLNNINLNCVLGYKKDGIYTSFLNEYDNDKRK